MKAKPIRIVLLCLVCLLVLAAAALVGVPFLRAGSALPEDAQLAVVSVGDGQYTASWSSAPEADGYRVEVSEAGDGGSGRQLLRRDVERASCALDGVEDGMTVRITVRPLRHYRVLGRAMTRAGTGTLRASVTAEPMPAGHPVCRVRDTDCTAALSWDAAEREGASYELCMLDYETDRFLPLCSTDVPRRTLHFGEDGDLPLPEYARPAVLAVRAVYREGSTTLYGTLSTRVTVSRDNLLGKELTLTAHRTGENAYTLSWNETKGAYYRLEQWDVDRRGWTLLAELPHGSGILTYETGRLPSCADCRFRISALGGDGRGEDEAAAAPGECSFLTDATPLYAAIWPLKELPVLDRPRADAETLDTAPAAVQLCVLGEENGYFLVQTDTERGYIDSDYCLIDLPDYLGDLCAYCITNSTGSIFKVHGYEIPEVTGTVVAGFEGVALADGRQLAPLLYPVANRLMEAARAVREDGYRLKIYEAYRPNMATKSVYSLTLSIIDHPLPARTVSGEPVTLPAAADSQQLTYRALVTNDRFTLANFLATRGSCHNMGIALDLTLERLDTGEELEMQTEMHDLSWYSSIYENNTAAARLDGYMKAAGFGGLTSEWWHFQDNELRTRLSLNIFLYPGVTAEGWMMDENGWRYRTQDGSYLRGCTRTLGGQSVEFDEAGYADRP